ncbi:MAG: family 43 glycosylhydrolase [Syntrophothermus sp.]
MKNIIFLFIVIVYTLSSPACNEDQSPAPANTVYFTNPVVQGKADPWVIKANRSYYYCFSSNNRIWVTKSAKLQEIGKDSPKEVWAAIPGTNYSNDLWAPELHYLNGKWYIYVAADDGNNFNHRIYVLEGSSQDPQDKFVLKGKLSALTDRWAIDGTVLTTDDNKMYFIWSGWRGYENAKQELYIAPMSNPWTISGERVIISSPELDWELHGIPLINEGPEVLKHNGSIFIIYSASGSWTDDYCLGQLTFTGGDILNHTSWIKNELPVFKSTGNVFGPGHASFVKSPDDKEDWIVYHAAKKQGSGWDRNIRIQKFIWNSDGSPNFGIPVSEDVKIPVPSE